MMGKRLDIRIGMVFERWTVIEVLHIRIASDDRKVRACRCVCQCGTERTVILQSLTDGRTKSCGCYIKEKCLTMNMTHGEATAIKTPEYIAWSSMKGRCSPTAQFANRYFARGIAVCDRWMKFENFLTDMGRKPSNAHTLERIDNDRGYEPGNCKWATCSEQANNRSSNRHLTIDGQTKRPIEWSAISGISAALIIGRLNRGWNHKDAVFHPLGVVRECAK